MWYRLMPADHPTITAIIEGGEGVDKIAVSGTTVADLKHGVIAANPKLQEFGAVDLTVYAGDGTGTWRKVEPDDPLRSDTLRIEQKEYRVVHPHLHAVDEHDAFPLFACFQFPLFSMAGCDAKNPQAFVPFAIIAFITM